MMPTRKELIVYVNDPAAFRDALILPSGRGPRKFGEIMADFQRRDFAAMGPAFLALSRGEQPPTPRFWLERTKGASKDSDLAVLLLWLLAFSPRAVDCQVGAADKDQAGEIRKRCKGILKANAWLNELIEIQNWVIRNPHTESACEIIAADIASSHGAIPDLLILNELSHVTKEEYALNLLDNAAKVPRGVVCIATNAGFLDTWQQAWRKTAESSDRWYFSTFTEPAPWLAEAEIDEARRRNTPTRFARLWSGVWVPEDSGDALDPADIDATITLPGRMPEGAATGQVFVAGLDLGLKHDHSALVILTIDPWRERVQLASCESWKPPYAGASIDLRLVKQAVADARKRYDVRTLIYDPWQCELMAQQLCAELGIRRIPWQMTPKNLDLMATKLLEVFRNKTISLYPDPDLIRDLQRLRIIERQTGYRLSPIKDSYGHGDRAMALATALPTCLASMPGIRREIREASEPETIIVPY